MKLRKSGIGALLLAFLLALLALGGCGGGSSDSGSPGFDGGSGTAGDPYLIANADSLLSLAANVNGGKRDGYSGRYFKLSADIDLRGIKWTPIGNMNDHEKRSTFFRGTFDGAGRTVSNLRYETDVFTVGAGLFGVSSGTIKDLNVVNAFVHVTHLPAGERKSVAIGGVVGYNLGAVENVALTGSSSILGLNCVGGVIGGNSHGTIRNCRTQGVEIELIGDNNFPDRIVQDDIAECGGLIVGGSFGGTISGCTASGTVKASGREPVGMGGIGGCLEMMDSITNCRADVKIVTTNGGHAIGGLCGYSGTHPDKAKHSVTNYPAIIDNCSVTIDIDAKDATHVGGLVGTGLYYYGKETAFRITNCFVSGTIDGAVTPGTILGRTNADSSYDAATKANAKVLVDGKSSGAEVGTTGRMYESADQGDE